MTLAPLPAMVPTHPKAGDVNVLTSRSDWAWPTALRSIFQPCGVNLMVADTASQFANVLRQQRVHATIIDADSQRGSLATLRMLRADYPRLPCLVVATASNEELLGRALRLGVFSVIDKPVDMDLLRGQLDRLFVKTYASDVFATTS